MVDPAGWLPVAGDKVADAHGGGTLTTSAADLVSVRLPLVPVMLSGYVPTGVLATVVMFNVEVVPGAGLGVNDPAAPDGSPITVKLTGPLNPPVGVMEI